MRFFRIACLFVPSFSLEARLRSRPELRHEPIAVLDRPGPSAQIIGATPAARSRGISLGLPLHQARVVFPALLSYSRDLEAEAAAQQALIETAYRSSPRIEPGENGLVYLDLCNDPKEFAWAENMRIQAKKLGVPAQVGIAGSKLSARIAAEMATDSSLIVPPGTDADFLAPLLVDRLRPPAEVTSLLKKWGVEKIGELAALPRAGLTDRLGRTGSDLHQKARGIDAQPLKPYTSPPLYSEGTELEWPILELDSFLPVAQGLLERLMLRLDLASLACRRLELNLKLDPQGHETRSLMLPGPSKDVKSLLGLLAQELSTRPPANPIVGILMAALPEQPRPVQLSLFGPPILSPDQLASTLNRLTALLGSDRIGSPRALAGYSPGRFRLESFRQEPDQLGFFQKRRPSLPAVTVRILKNCLSLKVDFPSPPAGSCPRFLRSIDRSTLRIEGAVRAAAGPWVIEDEWWTDASEDRQYWDVELSDGHLYRIFQDLHRGSWFADGVYD